MTTISPAETSALSFMTRRRAFLLGSVGVAITAVPAITQAAPDSDGAIYKKGFEAFRNKSLDQKVQELADREELRELIARYAHRVAHGVSAADLFTDDGAFIVRMPGHPVSETRGRDALNKQFATISATATQHDTLPMIHNYLFDISANEATGLCSIELRTTQNGQSIIASGYYEDRFRRETGRWRFVVRDAHFFHWVTLQEGWAHPPAAS